MPFFVCLSDLQSIMFPGGSDIKNLPKIQETQVPSLGWEDLLEKRWQPTPVFLPGEARDRGAWRATVHGLVNCRTRLSD